MQGGQHIRLSQPESAQPAREEISDQRSQSAEERARRQLQRDGKPEDVYVLRSRKVRY